MVTDFEVDVAQRLVVDLRLVTGLTAAQAMAKLCSWPISLSEVRKAAEVGEVDSRG